MSEAGLLRRSPGAPHVRLTALSLFVLGLGLGFLGILVLRQSGTDAAVMYAMPAAAAGALLAVVPGRRLLARNAPGRGTRAYLTVCGAGAVAGMIALLFAEPRPLDPVRFALLGLACGGALRLCLALVLAMLPPRRAESLMGLFGVSVGLGGCTANLIGMIAASPSRTDPVLLSAAIVPLLLAVASFRAGRVAFEGVEGRWDRERAPQGTAPRGFLMAASLLLQAAACAIAASWLAAYLSRRVGLSLVDGAAVMALFWLALSAGWAHAGRLPTVRENLLPLAVAPLLAVPGAAILLSAGGLAVVAAGTAMLGVAMGMLFPLTLCLGHWPATLGRSRWVTRSLHLALVAALLASWAVGALAHAAGTATPVWIILGCFLGASGAVFVLVVDYRISGDVAVI